MHVVKLTNDPNKVMLENISIVGSVNTLCVTV